MVSTCGCHDVYLSQKQVELRIRAVGLNFRDVEKVMAGDCAQQCFDCSGTVVAGMAAGLRPGQDVFGIARGCLQSFACAEGSLLAPKPSDWSFEELVAWPRAWLAVQQLALKQGERVLIHAATSGVGLVAVQFAQHVGATIFATCREEKVQHLKELGVKYITSSSQEEAFDALKRARNTVLGA